MYLELQKLDRYIMETYNGELHKTVELYYSTAEKTDPYVRLWIWYNFKKEDYFYRLNSKERFINVLEYPKLVHYYKGERFHLFFMLHNWALFSSASCLVSVSIFTIFVNSKDNSLLNIVNSIYYPILISNLVLTFYNWRKSKNENV